MKKKIVILVSLVVFSFSLMSPLSAESRDDIQAIKKAVKENPNYQAGQEVKWFKVLVHDTKTKRDKVKVTLPISLVEIFIKYSHDKDLKINCDEYKVDLKELFAELKKLGPLALVEIYEDDEIVKVWLE